jgi:hypothetical protein
MAIVQTKMTYQSPLPRGSPLPFPLESRFEAWPAAAEAKLDGICEGMIVDFELV